MTVLKEVISRYETDGRIVKCFDIGELIRCKDCWCWNEEEQHGCTHDMGANDFCSKAERKE